MVKIPDICITNNPANEKLHPFYFDDAADVGSGQKVVHCPEHREAIYRDLAQICVSQESASLFF